MMLYAVADGERHPNLRVRGQIVEVDAKDLEVASDGVHYVLPTDLLSGLAPGRYDFRIIDGDIVHGPSDLEVHVPIA